MNEARPKQLAQNLFQRPLLGLSLSLLACAGCSSVPSNQQVQQQAAQTTQQVKQSAEQAADKARVAAAKAEDKINALAAGVKQGMGGSAEPVIDLNSASRDQLVTLPGISPEKARRIIAGRPYSAPDDLVSRNLLRQDQFNRISGRVKAVPPAS